ncbi:MAG: hypothetical protein ACJ8F3_02590 [Xanthobacteraceae bacterium]
MHTAVAAIAFIACSTFVYAQSLDQQERCAQQASRAFQQIDTEAKATNKRMGFSPVSNDYQSHYNTKIGKCLILVETATMLGDQLNTSANLMDAIERRYYASYLWISRKDNKNGQVLPSICELIPSVRAKKLCTSREEFDEFVAGYME